MRSMNQLATVIDTARPTGSTTTLEPDGRIKPLGHDDARRADRTIGRAALAVSADRALPSRLAHLDGLRGRCGGHLAPTAGRSCASIGTPLSVSGAPSPAQDTVRTTRPKDCGGGAPPTRSRSQGWQSRNHQACAGAGPEGARQRTATRARGRERESARADGHTGTMEAAVHDRHPPEGTPRARRPRRTQRANGARKGLADAARSGSTSRVGERTNGEG